MAYLELLLTVSNECAYIYIYMEDHYVVIKSAAPLFLHPIEDSEYTDEAIYGMTAEIIEERNNWCYVLMEYNYKGWMLRENLSETRDSDWKKRRNCLIQSPAADVMPSGSYRGAPSISLFRGSMVQMLPESKKETEWIKVSLQDGNSGYCRREWLRLFDELPDTENQDLFRKAVIKDAEFYLGCAYRWGGKTILGIDCSGLTFMSYWMNGVSIYRDSVINADFPIKEVDFQDVKPGDLLYFPGHIVMCITEDSFIHSSGPRGGVVYCYSLEELSVKKTAAGSIYP